MERVPKRFVGSTEVAVGLPGAKLCDLDESVWDKVEPDVVLKLAEIVVDRVAAGCARRTFHDRHFPRPPEGMTLADLRLEHRTHLCLAREGFEDDPAALGEHTIGDILSIRAFGPRCLVDLLSGLETLLGRDGRLHRELTAEAERLAALPEAAKVLRNDPRFGPLIYEVDIEARSAKELAERLIARTHDAPDPLFATARLRELHNRIATMSSLPLEEELIQIFAATPHERNREVVIGYYGWADGRRHTLAQVGARYGMTRERTRQICAKLVKKKNPETILAPVMDRTLAFLAERLPRAVGALERELAEAGLTAVGLRMENVAGGAALLDRPVPFTIVRVGDGKLAVEPGQADVPPSVVELAKKEIYYHGLATVKQIERTLARKFPGRASTVLVSEVLQLIAGFCWLDRQRGWFRLLSVSQHGLPRAIDKILAVAGEVRARDLRAAVGRNHRMWKVPPPESVLLEFCRRSPGMRVEDDRIIPDPPRDWREALRGVEAQLVEILERHGPVMERGALEDLCVGAGMNRFSFHAFIASSPVITQFGHSVYGLLGSSVSRQTVQSLILRRRTERAPTRVLDGHGRTDDGKVWLRYRLSKAASTYAVITVPSALKNVVSGKFKLLTPDGHHVGTLAAKDGRAWGLGAFLRRHGAKVDDRLAITLDLEARTAVISMGESSA